MVGLPVNKQTDTQRGFLFERAGLMLIRLICEYCGKEYYRKPSRAKNSRFCSYSCKGKVVGAQVLKPYRLTPEIMKERWNDPEYRATMTERVQGENNPFYGRIHSKRTKQAISQANSGRKRTPAEISARATSLKRRYQNDPTFKKRAAARLSQITTDPKWRERQSKRMTGAGNPRFGKPAAAGSGHCQWFEYQRSDNKVVKLQGTFELRFARLLDKLHWNWITHGEIRRLPYCDSQDNEHTYAPDFYLPDFDLYIDNYKNIL